MSSKLWCISAMLPEDRNSPLIRTVIFSAPGSGISSAVTIQGPMTLPVSKSFPFAGPSPTTTSRFIASREVMSLKIVYPKTWALASARSMSRPVLPMNIPNSSS
jgi:hypothetical protein